MDNVGALLFWVGAVGTWYFIKKKKDAQKRNISIGLILLGFLLIGVFREPSDDEQATPDITVESTLSSSELQAIEESKEAERIAKEEEKAKKQEEEEKEKKVKEEEETSDITKLTDSPTTNQAITLSTLADMQFSKSYPYQGSKMHSILGVMQDWTSTDGEKWFYKVEATIVNAFGAERKANLEVYITPISPDSGYVEFIDY